MEHYKKPIYKLGLFLILLAVASIMTHLYWIKYSMAVFGIDDANIYFIYMRNLANGYGFVYNIGGEKVEGFTSMLWVLIGSVFYLFTSKPESLLVCLNVVFITFTIWKICLFADAYFKDKRMISPYTIIITGFILLIPGYVQWTTFTIMETGLWSMMLTFLFVGIAHRHISNRRDSGDMNVLLVLLLITRPESYLWALLAIAFQFISHFILNDRSIKRSARTTLISILVLICGIGLLTGFRMLYFGYPLPNTYYAKISSDLYSNYQAGLKYMSSFFHYYTPHLQLPVIGIIVSVFAILTGKKNAVVLFMFPVIMTISYLIPLYTGGDHFGLFRFIQPFIPLFSLFYIISFFTFFPLKKWFWYIPALLSLIAIFYSCRINYYNFTEKKSNIKIEFWIAYGERQYAEELNDFFQYQQPYPSYGIFVAGAGAYTYKGVSIDLLGLNNVAMAHSSRIKTGLKNHGSFNKDVFFKQKPDLFFYTRVYRDTSEYEIKEREDFKYAEWNRDLFKNIFEEDRFKAMYFPVFIFSKKDPRVVQTHTNQEFLDKLNPNVYWYYKIPVD